MNAEENKEVIKRFMDEVWNKGNEGMIDKLYAPHGKARGIGGDYAAGPARFKAFYHLMQSTCKDFNVTIKSIMAEGDEVLFYGTFHFTHRTTGKRVSADLGGLGKLKDGKIIEAFNLVSFLEALIQLGAIQEDALPRALLQTK